MSSTDRLVEEVWIRGYLMEDDEGNYLLVEPTHHPDHFAAFGMEEVEFLLCRSLEGPCLDAAKDYTADRYPVEEREDL